MHSHHSRCWQLLCAMALALPLAALAQSLYAEHPCTEKVSTASDAAAKADWIVEGTVDMLATFPSDGLTVTLGDTKAIRGGWPKHGGSGTVSIGADAAGAGAQFEGEAGRNIQNKRVRLFGTRHAAGAQRRVFFMQVATDPMPAMAPPAAPAVTRLYRDAAREPIGNGWHRAHSTEGRFAIDMPAPFQDMTGVTNGDTGFMLRATDAAGRTFIAVREPRGADPSMAGSFDTGMDKGGATVTQFQGVPALVSRSVNGPAVRHSVMFRVPGATWMLGVALPLPLEQQDAKRETALRERFFQSLACS